MRHPRPILALLVISAILVACSSPGGDSSGPSSEASSGAIQPDASQATASSVGEATATPDSGGGGGASEMTYQITGGYTQSGTLSLVGPASYYDVGGIKYLSFSSTDTSTIMTITIDPDPANVEANIVVFGNGEFTISAVGCKFNLTRNVATAAAGSFECRDAHGVSASGGTVTVTVTGTFDAHA